MRRATHACTAVHEHREAERHRDRRQLQPAVVAERVARPREVEGLGEIANSPMVAPAIAGAPMIVDVRTPGRITMRPAQDKPAKTAALDAPLPSGQQ